VLLSQEANAVEHLACASAGFVQAGAKLRILALELFHPFGTARSRRRCFERFYSRFCFESAGTEGCEFVAKVTHQPVEIGKRRLELSLFVV
jgi:hypothetical protein